MCIAIAIGVIFRWGPKTKSMGRFQFFTRQRRIWRRGLLLNSICTGLAPHGGLWVFELDPWPLHGTLKVLPANCIIIGVPARFWLKD
jgi:hypothetical protein